MNYTEISHVTTWWYLYVKQSLCTCIFSWSV